MKCGNRLGMGLTAACAALLAASTGWAQQSVEKVVVNDVDRSYVVRLPKGYDAKQQHYPVVILLHGMGQDSEDVQRLTRFDELADKDGVITVYPRALHGQWNVGVRPQVQDRPMNMGQRRRRGYGYPGGGYPGGGYPQGGGQQQREREAERNRQEPADDVEFMNQMLDQMGNKFSVDASRVYAAGLSEGGFMSLRLGCTLSDRITAVAAVGAAMPKQMVCVPTRAVPVVMINGTSDPVVHYGGGTEKNRNLSIVSVEDSAKAWARMDRCGEKPEKSKLKAHGKGGMETKIQTFNGCQSSAQVVLYSVQGGGNTWPGGEQYEVEKTIGKTSQDPNANEVIWNFFAPRKLAAASTDAAGAVPAPSGEKK